ncbi:16S rRNA (cytosine(967)-C(5))-methyltransferase RsmB [Roseburia sp. TF10-5]|nr:16S rRNA (cytosine(967)-C(5))-methyltransferase RsmB [Roseburia sp. TF10-5]
MWQVQQLRFCSCFESFYCLEEEVVTTKVNERALVLEMLLAVNEEGQYSHLVLRDVLDKYQYLGKQERAFLTRLMEGTLERQLTLDYVIDQFSKTRVKKMKPLIRNLMRMSVYQIMYMDSVPDSAVCNEAVKLARKRGFSGLSGFVNGVLRSVARGWREVRFPNLSVTYSMPEWIVDIWTENYGEEKTRQILEGLTAENRLTIRTNLSAVTPEELVNKLKAEGVTVHAVPELPYAFEISGLDYLAGLKSFKEGLFYVQDVSSMLVAETAAPKKNDYVIDVCAAPGGKSTHMAELLQGSGMVEARDLTEYKVDLIRENIARHGLSNMKAVQMDATVDDPDSHQKADVLVCDLPCSGLGVMGKKTDIRYKMTKEKAAELAKLQRQILSVVWDYVRPGGTLVYSTCTIHRSENEDNTAWFLKEHPEFSLEFQRQIFPGEAGSDGFFLAKLVRSK